MDISKFISELLSEHDCVIVPDMGGFVANLSPAAVHSIQHVFSPPCKDIVFNKNLKRNDGLLAHHIAVSQNKTYPEACKIIANYVTGLNEILHKGEKVSIENVGSLYFDVEQNIQFEPDRSINYLLDSFGLASLHSLPIKRENYQARIEKHFTDRKPIPTEKKKISIKRVSVVTATAIIILAAIWIPLKTDMLKNINYSNLDPFPHDTNKPVVTSETSSLDNVKNAYPEEEKKDTAVLQTEMPSLPVTAKLMQEDETENKYHIIGGCFTVLNNAESLVNKLQQEGYNASIVDQDKKFYRVKYNSYSDRTDALVALANIRSGNPHAWLLVK